MAWPTHRQLRTFLATVETGGISTAARALNLTQPAASQQLRELERCLGVRLLERAGGRTAPTAAGQAVLGPAARAQAAVEDVMAAAAAHRSGEVGRVRLGTGATACIYLLPPVLAAVRQRMPGLEVQIATGNSAEICHQVETGALDAGLVTLPATPGRALSVTALREDALVALIPLALAQAADAVTPASLAALPLILYEPGGSTRAIIDAWFRAAGVAVHPTMQLDSIETIKVLVGQGLGASVMPALALGVPVAGAVMRTLQPPLARRLGVVLRREKVLDRGLRVVLEALGV
ncbi:MAG: LysR family transcriptional regulator [Acetobacteraceae bacterium]|nr:LysR family transcriptional regulator [Acetobacteraceae bacterium]